MYGDYSIQTLRLGHTFFKKNREMKLDLLNIEYEPQGWFWLTIAYLEFGEQSRSLLHIEKNNGVWKFQLLWLRNNCWIIE